MRSNAILPLCLLLPAAMRVLLSAMRALPGMLICAPASLVSSAIAGQGKPGQCRGGAGPGRVSACVCLAATLLTGLSAGAAAAPDPSDRWPLWEAFVERFIQKDGRVIDLTFDAKSTSEGQSYALFFALVANQPERFNTILEWTDGNLAGGELGQTLPAWHWGEKEDGEWGIKDPNSASDSDLWIAYTLLEAGRLWSRPDYTSMGNSLLGKIAREEVAQAGQAGPVLLPGRYGFRLEGDRFRINPSYLPGFMFDYLREHDPEGPWAEVWDSFMELSPEIFAEGVAPDLYVVDRKGRVHPDSETSPTGSYDAIRVYLWAGMSQGGDREDLLSLLRPFARLVDENDAPPEKVNPVSGEAFRSHYSPPGYSGAVLPFLHALDRENLLEKEKARVNEQVQQALEGAETQYYDQALILFGEGWISERYRFDEQGRLQPNWRQ